MFASLQVWISLLANYAACGTIQTLPIINFYEGKNEDDPHFAEGMAQTEDAGREGGEDDFAVVDEVVGV
jgi:hypothetical protein